jgi:hypothetical protein
MESINTLPQKNAPSEFDYMKIYMYTCTFHGAKLHAQGSPAKTTIVATSFHKPTVVIATSFHKPRQIQVLFTMRVIIVFLASLVLVATRTLAAAAETKKTWQNQMLL